MRLGVTVLVPLVGLGILVGCGTRNADRVRPIAEKQRGRGLVAVQALEQALNHSLCGSILDTAGEQLRKHWIEQCDHIRETWGDWHSFSANYWYRSGPNAIAVEGLAGFSKGDCTVQVIWDLESRSPRVLAFFLTSKEDQVEFPALPHRLMDAPPIRRRQSWPWLARSSHRPPGTAG